MKKLLIKRYFLTAIVTIFSFNACDVDRLDTPPLGLTEESYFTLESQYNEVLYGTYAKMTDWFWFHAQDISYPMYILPGDDITETAGRFPEWEIFSNLNPTNGKIAYFFESAYRLIQSANVLIEKTSTADRSLFADPSFLDKQRGEALFLRALTNFYLYNMFGTAPLVVERLGAENMHQPKSEGTQLLDQVILDCQTALPLLPASWPDHHRGRATQNSANGLLMKALVFRGDYTGNVADYFAAVEAYNNITATLTADYTHNFSAATENNSESLFEFQASQVPGGDDNVWLQNDGPWRGTEVMTSYWGFYTVEGNQARNNLPGDNWKVTEKMFNLYGTDPRVAFFTEANRDFTKYGKLGLDELANTGVGSLNNVRLFRYAESKLLAAEAILLSGGSKADAIGLVNEVRSRARNWAGTAEPADRSTAETDDGIIMQWIEDERVAELLGEPQIRWFDLKRWDARGYKDLSTWGGGDEHFSTDLSATFQFQYPKHLLFPLPQAEVERNEQIIENNPQY